MLYLFVRVYMYIYVLVSSNISFCNINRDINFAFHPLQYPFPSFAFELYLLPTRSESFMFCKFFLCETLRRLPFGIKCLVIKSYFCARVQKSEYMSKSMQKSHAHVRAEREIDFPRLRREVGHAENITKIISFRTSGRPKVS